MCQVGFRVQASTKAGKEERAWSLRTPARLGRQESRSMMNRFVRLLSAMGAVAAMAIAGGASLKGF
jgi:hypothetical protein